MLNIDNWITFQLDQKRDKALQKIAPRLREENRGAWEIEKRRIEKTGIVQKGALGQIGRNKTAAGLDQRDEDQNAKAKHQGKHHWIKNRLYP